MIARVRIAPVEQWCHWYAKDLPKHPVIAGIAGLAVEIETTSMRSANCDPEARMWDATMESWKKLYGITGESPSNLRDGKLGICEHMLEMD